MKTYLAHKNQVQGIKDVLETVKTVEKIAASSVHFLKKEVSNLNVYTSNLDKILIRLSLFYKKKNHPFSQKKITNGKALVIFTSDKGLVGGLWHEIINVFLRNNRHYNVIIIGKKGKQYLAEEKISIIKSFVNISIIPQEEEIEHIADYIFDEFKKGVFSQVDILYPQFISLAEQKPNFVMFLPFEFKLVKKKKNGDGLPIFEPSKQKIFNKLLEKYIKMSFHRIVIEAKLSELFARTVAMEHSVTKTEEFIQKLTLDYMKQRHRIVTQRQLESFTAHKMVK